ncbi:MAG: archease [Acidobacteria bacterium]|nr:archease [Acidobacteriota bacterium]
MCAMRCGYQLLDHPADLGIEAIGQSLIEAFEQEAVGLMSVILDVELVQCCDNRVISLQAADMEQLLVKWLTEILYLYDGIKFAAVRFQIDELTSTSLSANVFGEPFSEDRHLTRLDIKAITYH